MKFKIKDKVIFKKNRIKAEIVMVIGKNKVRIKDEEGLEYIVPIRSLIHLNKQKDHARAYGKEIDLKDINSNKNIDINKKRKRQKKEKIVIDLHIESITTNYHEMNNISIIEKQIDYCKKQIKISLRKNIHEITIIHGIGEGVLREKVHNLIKEYQLKFFESKDGGATYIIL